MKKWQKVALRRKIALIGLAALFIVVFFRFGIPFLSRCYQEKYPGTTMAEVYSINWKLNLPNNLTVEENFTSDHGWPGDGVRFTIFSPPSAFGDSLMNASEAKSAEAEEFAKRIAEELEVEADYLPDFDKPYVWKIHTQYSNNKLLVVYAPWQQRLYFIEEIF